MIACRRHCSAEFNQCVNITLSLYERKECFAWNFFIKRIRKKELSQTDNSLLSVKPFCSYVVSNWCQTNPTMPKSDGISRLFSPAASLSGNYDLNGQRSASPCWPSAVAQQRLNRPRLKVCDSLLFTILSLAHALAYAAYTVKYRLHSRFVRICLPFTYSLYHFFGALQLEISTGPIRPILQTAFSECSACYFQSLWGFYVFNFILQFTHARFSAGQPPIQCTNCICSNRNKPSKSHIISF